MTHSVAVTVSDRAARQRFRDDAGERQFTLALEDDPRMDWIAQDEPGFARIEDELSPDDPKPITARDAQLETIRVAVAGLSDFEQDVYYRTFGPPRMSTRDIVAEMHGQVSQSTVQRTVDGIKAKIAEALGVAAPGDPTAEEAE